MANSFLIAVFTRPLPHGAKELRALGAKECSRQIPERSVRAGILCYVRRLAGTGLWMAYLMDGRVFKMTTDCAKQYLSVHRDKDGRPAINRDGTGERLARIQNERAGDIRRRQHV
jgi:hypothetical protein